jgi:hypothetical protein
MNLKPGMLVRATCDHNELALVIAVGFHKMPGDDADVWLLWQRWGLQPFFSNLLEPA